MDWATQKQAEESDDREWACSSKEKESLKKVNESLNIKF